MWEMKKCNGWFKKKTTLEARIRFKKKIGKNLMKLSIHWRNYSEYNTWGKRNREWEREKAFLKHKWKEQHKSTCITEGEKKNGESHCSQKDKEEKRERKGTNEKILNI